MATDEDQAQLIVRDRVVIQRCKIRALYLALLAEFFDHRLEAGATSYLIDGFESSCGNQPGTGIMRNTITRPGFQRSTKRFVQRLFGKIKITEEADQRGQDAARISAVNSLNCLPNPF